MSEVTAPEISVVVPARNAGEVLSECLTRLHESTGCRYEVIVVDDGSTDATRAIADAMRAHVVLMDRSYGPAVARNRGAAEASGEIILFLDADVLVGPQTLSRMLQTIRDVNCDAVFGSYDTTPTALNLVSQYKNLLHHYVHQKAGRDASTFWSGCGAVSRDSFLEVGGFDERFLRPCVEDIEFGMRLKLNGGRIRLNPDVQVTHTKRWTLRTLIQTDVFDRAVPWTRLVLEHRSMPNDLNLKISQRVCVVLTCMLAALLTVGSLSQPSIFLIPVATYLAVVGADRFSQRAAASRMSANVAAVTLLSSLLVIALSVPAACTAVALTVVLIVSMNFGFFRYSGPNGPNSGFRVCHSKQPC